MQGYSNLPNLHAKFFPTMAGSKPATSDISTKTTISSSPTAKRSPQNRRRKFVAPQPIENVLKTSPYILNAMVVGDLRKFRRRPHRSNPVTVSARLAEMA